MVGYLLYAAAVGVAPYKVAALVSVGYLVQVCLTRKFHSLPPVGK